MFLKISFSASGKFGNINQNQQQSTSQLSKDEEPNALKEQSQKMKKELERI
jgi:hypothetical protein